MNTLFTTNVLDWLKGHSLQPESRADLERLLASLEEVPDAKELAKRPETLSLREANRESVLVVQSGSMRAVVTTDQRTPDRLVVISVFADEPREVTATLQAASSTLEATARVG